MAQQSRYLKPQRELKIFQAVAVLFFFTLYVLPQYFGLPFPLFDLTALRIMIVAVLLLMMAEPERIREFVLLVVEEPCTKVLLPYLMVIGYTMVLRADVNAFLNPFIELLTFYLLIYLETIKGLYTGRFVRSGSYRIMSSCNHSLGYGLMLVTMVPFACYDRKNKSVNLLAQPLLLLLLGVNVFLCGSRSTLSVFLLEVILLVGLSSKMEIKKFVMIALLLAGIFAVILAAIRNTTMGRYILLQITSILDELLGTELAVQFGADLTALSSSSNYRDQLKYIFTVDWLNPLLGLGRKRSFKSEINGSFIESVDNFYIAEYVRYAYPGMITYLLFLGSMIAGMIKRVRRDKIGLPKILLVGSVCYLINLFWVDSLQTLKYLYILFALSLCLDPVREGEDAPPMTTSKYLKKRGAR